MKTGFPRIKPMGERAILIEFASEINENTLQKVLFFKERIKKFYDEVNVEVIPAYHSLIIFYPLTINTIYDEVSRLKPLFVEEHIPKETSSPLFCIPVCYEGDFAPDLSVISGAKNLKISEIIKLHTAPVYTVYFIGFLPGFLYLGGLDEKLHFPRKKEPEMKLQKGAVGIGGNQTGIYPQESPGGWNIIGNSPVNLFDKNSDPPCEISAGDKVKFYSVTKTEYYKISKEIEKGTFTLKKEMYAG